MRTTGNHASWAMADAARRRQLFHVLAAQTMGGVVTPEDLEQVFTRGMRRRLRGRGARTAAAEATRMFQMLGYLHNLNLLSPVPGGMPPGHEQAGWLAVARRLAPRSAPRAGCDGSSEAQELARPLVTVGDRS